MQEENNYIHNEAEQSASAGMQPPEFNVAEAGSTPPPLPQDMGDADVASRSASGDIEPTPPPLPDDAGSADASVPSEQQGDDVTSGSDGSAVQHEHTGGVNGVTKCPKCGSSDISLNPRTGKLRCNFCRFEFEAEQSTEFTSDIKNLEGEVIGAGAKTIDNDAAQSLVTMKCPGCGAEVVINTAETTQARCHWCRSYLSVNDTVPNGAVPDMLLPFAIDKREAKTLIDQFVGDRKFFAHPQFSREYCVDNVMGVYLPYMLVDVNAHMQFEGVGEHEARRYFVQVGSKDNRHTETRYDVDVYELAREFDMTMTDLTIESSSDKIERNASDRTNNIINSILPFDTENCLQFDSNYLRGFTSEKRDLDVESLKHKVDVQTCDVGRMAIDPTLQRYDRGVRWDHERLKVVGRQWKTALMPVWLYSYRRSSGTLHYVAVNGRTKETMGSVPINYPKLILFSVVLEIICFAAKIFIEPFDAYETTLLGVFSWFLLLGGPGFYYYFYSKYRNSSARHHHEYETKHDVTNVQTYDQLVRRRHGVSDSSMMSANNHRIYG